MAIDNTTIIEATLDHLHKYAKTLVKDTIVVSPISENSIQVTINGASLSPNVKFFSIFYKYPPFNQNSSVEDEEAQQESWRTRLWVSVSTSGATMKGCSINVGSIIISNKDFDPLLVMRIEDPQSVETAKAYIKEHTKTHHMEI